MSKIGTEIVRGLKQFAEDLRKGDLSRYRRTEFKLDDKGRLVRTVYKPK